MKPLGKVKIKWSANFAYAIGLLVTDGSVSKDGRHIDFTSKDKEQLQNFMKCLNIDVGIGEKVSGYTGRLITRIQFSDVEFWKFLSNVGIMPAKTKKMSSIKMPKKFFFDFLRGHFDGDGTFYSYWDPRWKSSFMFYTVFVSSSKKHIDWLRGMIGDLLKINGHVTTNASNSLYQLKYSKAESLKLLPKMYYSSRVISLTRKRRKIEEALKINAG